MTITEYNPAKTDTLTRLRQDGYRVFVSHKRLRQEALNPGERVADFAPDMNEVFATRHDILVTEKGKINTEVEPKGGVTVVNIYKGDTLLGEGVAYCCEKDAFNKRRGLTIALGRALKAVK